MKCYVVCDVCKMLELENRISYCYDDDGLTRIVCFDCQPSIA